MKPPKTGNEEEDRKASEKMTDDALKAWRKAYDLARDNIERQGVLLHFARFQINAGRFDEARKNLNSVTNDMFAGTKRNLTRKLEGKEKEKTN